MRRGDCKATAYEHMDSVGTRISKAQLRACEILVFVALRKELANAGCQIHHKHVIWAYNHEGV